MTRETPPQTAAPPTTLTRILRDNARRSGDRPALRSSDANVVTHADLDAWVSRFAAGLRRWEIGRTDRVVTVLPDGIPAAAAFLGVAAGAVAAPLNPALGPAELEALFTGLHPAAVILGGGSGSAAADAAARLGIRIIELHPPPPGRGVLPEFDGMPAGPVPPGPEPAPDEAALILHTSGTTARPKQVVLTHGNLAASGATVARTLGLAPEDRGLAVMPLFHIHGLVAALLAPLSVGGSVIPTGGFLAGSFAGWLLGTGATWYTAVPTMHQAVLARLNDAPDLFAGHRLRLIRSSSAALAPAVHSALERAFGVPVIEAYGMTEAAHQMASNPVPPGTRKPGSVGPAAGPLLAILTPEGRTSAPDRRGEVVIRGPGVMAGYADNPEANAEAFADGWFRTGDEGYLDADGYLHLTGRLKEMINRGGEKVAPREVDEILLQHPAVGQAVAFAVPHPTLGEDLAAAVVLRTGHSADEPALRAFALERLAPFKVPSRIVPVDEIPKGPTGKIQRIGLAERLAAALADRLEPPVGAWETAVAERFADSLGRREPVGRHTNFFSAGGDSLRATALAHRLAREFGLDLPAGIVFRLPTPALLGAHLGGGDDDVEALARRLEDLDPETVERLIAEAERDGP